MTVGVYRVKAAGHDPIPSAVRRVGDLELHIDRPRGTQRTWNLPDGPLTKTYPVDYGYLPGHHGEDNEPLDFFVGSDADKGWHGSFHKKKHEFDANGVRTGNKLQDETKYFAGLTPEEHAEVLKMFDGPSGLVANHRFFSSLPGLQGALSRHRVPEPKVANADIRRLLHFEDLSADKTPAMRAISDFARKRLEDAQRVIPNTIKPQAKLSPVRGINTPLRPGKYAAHKTKTFLGHDFKIDRPKGFVKTWDSGKSFTYPCDYGYFPKYKGEDGEGLDAFVGDDPEGAFESFLKLKPGDDGKYVPDETKFLLGVSAADKKKIYALYGDKEVSELKTYSGMEEAMEAAEKFPGKGRFAKKAEVQDQLRAHFEDLLNGRTDPAELALQNVDMNDERLRNKLLGAVEAAKLLGLKTAHRANPFGKVQASYLVADEDQEFDAAPDFWSKSKK